MKIASVVAILIDKTAGRSIIPMNSCPVTDPDMSAYYRRWKKYSGKITNASAAGPRILSGSLGK